MAQKTIPQLQEASSFNANAIFPFDSGIQTFKILAKNMADSLFALMPIYIQPATFLAAFWMGKEKNVNAQTTSAGAFYVSPDGTKLYVINTTTNVVYQYTMTTPYDVSTAAYDSKSYDPSETGNNNTRSLWFKNDGTKMYVGDSSKGGSHTLYQYTLSTAWDVSTASYDSVSFSFSAQGGNQQCLFFHPEGTAFWLEYFDDRTIKQYVLSTPWDLSTASYDSVSLSTSGDVTNVNSFCFNPSGTEFFVLGSGGDIHKYNCSTPFDLDTASYVGQVFDVSEGGANSDIMRFSWDGIHLYVSNIRVASNPLIGMFKTSLVAPK